MFLFPPFCGPFQNALVGLCVLFESVELLPHTKHPSLKNFNQLNAKRCPAYDLSVDGWKVYIDRPQQVCDTLQMAGCTYMALVLCLCFSYGYGRPKFIFHFELFLFRFLPNRKMCKIFLVAMTAFQYKPTLFTTGQKDERKKKIQRSTCKYCRGVCFS